MKYIILACVILFGFISLYRVKNVVSDQIHLNNMLIRQIKDTDKELRLLKADWAYLNRPQRLMQLAEKLLGLSPITPSQVEKSP